MIALLLASPVRVSVFASPGLFRKPQCARLFLLDLLEHRVILGGIANDHQDAFKLSFRRKHIAYAGPQNAGFTVREQQFELGCIGLPIGSVRGQRHLQLDHSVRRQARE